MQVISEARDFNRICLNNFGKVIVLVFHAQWHEHSTEYMSKFNQLLELAQPPAEDLIFATVDAEKVPEVAKTFSINQVPTVIFTDSQKEILVQSENEVPALVLERLEEFLKKYKSEFNQKKDEMYKKIEKLLKENAVIVFIKGTPDDPQCKFTRQFLEVLKDLQIKFAYYDIIADSDMRNWLRHYDNWPTYPQMFIEGKLVGGLDKVKQQIAEGTLQPLIPESSRIFDPESRFNKILQENLVVLFSEGLPGETQDETSIKIMELLKSQGIKFNILNVNIDLNLQKYLTEKYGRTQLLFSNQKLLGSLPEISDLASKDQLLPLIPGSEWRLNGEQKFKYLLKNCKILAFIDGTPKDPLSENSKQFIQILNSTNIHYDFFNVRAEPEVLNSLLQLSKLNQVPQLYLNQQLIGDLETVQKLNQEGKLLPLLQSN